MFVVSRARLSALALSLSAAGALCLPAALSPLPCLAQGASQPAPFLVGPADPAVGYTAGPGLQLVGNEFSIANGGVTNSMLGTASVSNGKIKLPLTLTGSSAATVLTVTNSSGDGGAIHATSAGGVALRGDSPATGVYGVGGILGVYGIGNKSASIGVLGGPKDYDGKPFGVYGFTSSADSRGVSGVSNSTTGVGVYGTSQIGVQGYSGTTNGVGGSFIGADGVLALSTNGNGVSASNGNSAGQLAGPKDYDNKPFGVYGFTSSADSRGVSGVSTSTTGVGVYGTSQIGVSGYSGATNGIGVYGNAVSSGNNTFPIGVYGTAEVPSGSGSGYAGYFNGSVTVIGTLNASVKHFKIDHPQDPENKYLVHASVESDQMKNIYDGVVTTNAGGSAIVHLPSWFQSLNGDFRYQLTVIGQFAQAVVSREIAGNQFSIRTDKPGVKVSWQVTGVRHDAFAQHHPLVVEEDKPDAARGTYLDPQSFNQPKTLAEDYARMHLEARNTDASDTDTSENAAP